MLGGVCGGRRPHGIGEECLVVVCAWGRGREAWHEGGA